MCIYDLLGPNGREELMKLGLERENHWEGSCRVELKIENEVEEGEDAEGEDTYLWA